VGQEFVVTIFPEKILKEVWRIVGLCVEPGWNKVVHSADYARLLRRKPSRGLGYLPGGHLPPPKFGHLPPPNSDISHPPKKKHLPGGQLPPLFFSSFFGALFLAFSTYSSWRTSRMGRRRCLMRWSWSTSSRGCVTRWSWSTSSRRCLTSWSWSTSSRGRRWKRSPRW